MNQYKQIQKIMSDISYSLTIPNNEVTKQDIYDTIKNLGIPCDLQGKYIGKVHKHIAESLNRKNGYFSASYQHMLPNDEWLGFSIYSKEGGSQNFKIKMYIPIKPAKIGESGGDIIKFLIDKQIVTNGKIANTFRSDSVILNFLNLDDANAVAQFITAKLANNLGTLNPFVPDSDGIGIIEGYDIDSSYMERVSGYLAIYIKECKKQDKLDLVNVEDFLSTLEDSLNRGRVSKPQEVKQLVENLKKIKQGSLSQNQIRKVQEPRIRIN